MDEKTLRGLVAAELAAATTLRRILAHLEGRSLTEREAREEVHGLWSSLRTDLEKGEAMRVSAPLPSGTTHPSTATREPIDGRYEIGRELGRGGMGRVFEAIHLPTRRPIALKMIDLGTRDPERALRFFRQEVIAAARLDHPNIVRVHDAEVEGDVLYLAMELVADGSLRRLLEAEGVIAPVEAVGILEQLCTGLAAAHEGGLIHRDLKPENVLLQPGPDGPIAKIADFGLAIVDDLDADDRLTGDGAPAGTPDYMSPEHLIDRERVTVASDLFSVGVIAYELLTGTLPFTTWQQRLEGAPTPLPRKVSHTLQGAVLRALAKSPDARFANASDLRRALLDAEV